MSISIGKQSSLFSQVPSKMHMPLSLPLVSAGISKFYLTEGNQTKHSSKSTVATTCFLQYLLRMKDVPKPKLCLMAFEAIFTLPKVP